MIQRTEKAADNMNNHLKVTCLDPGVTTGYATGLLTDGRLGIASGQSKWKEFELYIQLKFSKPDIIVYESFEYRRGLDRVSLFPRNLIGVVNMYSQERSSQGNPVDTYVQTPAQGKSGYYTDKVLKKDRLYKAGHPHANDAVRHLLYWFTFGGGFKYNTGGYEPLA